MEPVSPLKTIAGCYAVVALHDVEPLAFCGVNSRHCIARIVGADSVGLWVDHPGWGRGVLPEERPARLLIRWTNIEALLVLSGGDLSNTELCCLAERSETPLRPIGFRLSELSAQSQELPGRDPPHSKAG